MDIAWALLLSFLILILLLGGFLLFLRSSISGMKNSFYILRKHPLFVILSLIILSVSVLYAVLNPWSIPLLLIPYCIFGIRMYEYVDDRFLDTKIGSWMMKQERKKFKIIPSVHSVTTVADMKKFLLMMHGIHGSRSQKDMRTTGKFYDDFVIELVAKDGHVQLYIVVNKSSLSTLLSAAKLYFPTVQFVEVEDTPVDILPDDYYEGSRFFKHMDIGELSPLKSDLFPTKVYEEIEHSLEEYKQNPITQLFEYLKQVSDGDMVVLQFLLRPQDTQKTGKFKGWQKEFEKLRKELMTNSTVSVSKDGSVSQLTPQELHILEGCEQKMNSLHFDSKLRFAFFGRNSTGKKYMGGIMTYLKQFATDKQVIIPKVKSWVESENATWGPFMDSLYFKPEVLMRKVKFYKGLVNRSSFTGGKTFFWDINSLAAILHIPKICYPGQSVEDALKKDAMQSMLTSFTQKALADSVQNKVIDDAMDNTQATSDAGQKGQVLQKGGASFNSRN